MRFTPLSVCAAGFCRATFVAEKFMPRGRGVKAVLREHFGEEYRADARATKRLAPGVF